MGLCGFWFLRCLGLNFYLLQMSTFFFESYRGWFGCDVSLRILVCYLVYIVCGQH
jgi:hypothetical protein